MLKQGTELILFDTPFVIGETTTPSTVIANSVKFYAKDNGSGVSTLCYKNDAGTEICFPTSGSFVTGTGTDNQIAIWNGTGTIDAFNATAGSVLFAGAGGILAQDNSNLFWDDSNNRLGVGTATPGFQFHGIAPDASSFNFTLETYGTGPVANYRGRAARGTLAAPSALQADDLIWAASGLPYGATGFASGARASIRFNAGENQTDTAQGTYISLLTTPLLSTTLAERFRIGPAGQLGIGGATYGTVGYIFKSGGVSASPTWTAPADVTAGSTQITLGGTPTGASLAAFSIDVNQANLDHGSIGGLSDDDHSGYALLAGRSGGQVLIGGTASGDDLTLQSTSNATRGDLITDVADITMVAASRIRMASQNRFRFLNSMARLTKSAAQTITTASPTVVTWDGTSFDTDSLFVDVDDTVTVQIAGKYLIVANIRWAANTTGFRVTSIESDASGSFVEEAASVYSQNTGSGDAGGQALAILNLAAGDKIRLIGYHTVGSDLDIVQTSLGGTSLTVAYIGE